MTARSPGRRLDHARRHDVVALLEPVVAAAGFDLEDVELRSVGRRLLVRVLVDGPRGITLDEVADVSQAVSDALDSDDVLGDEPYTLEVSSPGVERPLTLPRHWRRNLGRLVAVTLADGTRVTGRLVEVADDDATVRLETSVKGRTSRTTVALADVARATVEVEFARAGAAEEPTGPGDAAGAVDVEQDEGDVLDEDDLDEDDVDDDLDDEDEDDGGKD